MRDLPSFSDQDLERLLAGKAPSGGDSADKELAAFAREVRAAFGGPLPPDVERRHLAAALEVSGLITDKGDPAARPASKANGPQRQASGLPKWRRRAVLSSLFATLTAKIAGAAVAAVAATGGLAAAGALPAPAQQAVASAASTVGISLPTPHSTTGAANKAAHAHDAAPTSTVSSDDAVNHGACVSYAASIAGTLGFSGGERGAFMATLAKDETALSAKVSDDGKPDAACTAAIDKAKAAAESPGKSGDDHGKPATPTATATANGNSPGFDADNHPTSTDHPDATSNPGSDLKPTDHPDATSNPGETHKP